MSDEVASICLDRPDDPRSSNTISLAGNDVARSMNFFTKHPVFKTEAARIAAAARALEAHLKLPDITDAGTSAGRTSSRGTGREFSGHPRLDQHRHGCVRQFSENPRSERSSACCHRRIAGRVAHRQLRCRLHEKAKPSTKCEAAQATEQRKCRTAATKSTLQWSESNGSLLCCAAKPPARTSRQASLVVTDVS